jgi:hypothetical protein
MDTTETTGAVDGITRIASDGEVWRDGYLLADGIDPLRPLRAGLTPAEYEALRAHRALLRAEGHRAGFLHYAAVEGDVVRLETDGWYVVERGEEADALLREAHALGAAAVRDAEYPGQDEGLDQYVVSLAAGDLAGARANRRALATGLRRFFRVEHG